MTKFNTATITQKDIAEAETKDLVELYNEISGKNIKKFADRKSAERQTWKMIQRLAPGEDIRKEKETSKKVSSPSKTPGKRDNYENRTINILAKENPKRPESRAHKKFEILMAHDGKTVKEFKEREGKYPTLDMENGWPATELRWALKQGLAKLSNGHSETKAA